MNHQNMPANVGSNDGLGVLPPTPYQQRAIDQGRLWVAGESHHNRIDDECCPDFSCCTPELYERDREKRAAEFNQWAAAHGWAQFLDA